MGGHEKPGAKNGKKPATGHNSKKSGGGGGGGVGFLFPYPVKKTNGKKEDLPLKPREPKLQKRTGLRVSRKPGTQKIKGPSKYLHVRGKQVTRGRGGKSYR